MRVIITKKCLQTGDRRFLKDGVRKTTPKDLLEVV